MSTATLTRPATPSGGGAPPTGGTGHLVGTGTLARFVLRRDRVRLSVWTGSLVLLQAYFVTALSALYPTFEDRQSRAALMESPVSTMLGGPGYGLDDYTIGAMLSNEIIGWVAIGLALLNVMQVVRTTRAEEEAERTDLVRAAVVGRLAVPAAVVLVLAVVNAVIGALSAAVMIGLGELAVADSVAVGLAYTLTGMVFAGIGVIVAQVTEHARGATGLGILALGVMYMLRAFGDMQEPGGSWLSWTSPIGWAQQLRAFVDLRWWPLLLSAGLVVVLLVVGAALAVRRDVGAGLIAPRRGPAQAPPSLRSPWALAWRQQRTALLWWAVGLGLLWLASGTYVDGVHDMVEQVAEENPAVLDLFGREDLVGGFVSVMVVFGMLLAAGYGISAVLRARAEEAAGRLEPVLGTAVSRGRWLGAQVGVAATGTAVLALVTVLALWAGATAVDATELGLATYLEAGAAYLPALALYLGLTAALVAWAPRLAALPWVLLTLGFVAGVFGGMLDLPEAVSGVDPFHWVPRVPVEEVTAGPLLALGAVAAVLLVGAFVGFRRRDVPAV